MENNGLPELVHNQDEELRKWLEKLQSFTALLNKQVEQDQLKDHKFIRGARYLPISFIEMKLDTLFFGLWNTKGFKWEKVGNEIIASIEVEVFHPFQKIWLTRTGAAGKQIMVDAPPEEMKDKKEKNKWALDPSNKKPAALEHGGFSTLKADCFKNGCLSIGKTFGRDVNRDDQSEYNAIIKGTGDDRELLDARKALSDAIQMCQVEEIKLKVIEETTEKERNGKPSVEFYEKQLEKLMG